MTNPTHLPFPPPALEESPTGRDVLGRLILYALQEAVSLQQRKCAWYLSNALEALESFDPGQNQSTELDADQLAIVEMWVESCNRMAP